MAERGPNNSTATDRVSIKSMDRRQAEASEFYLPALGLPDCAAPVLGCAVGFYSLRSTFLYLRDSSIFTSTEATRRTGWLLRGGARPAPSSRPSPGGRGRILSGGGRFMTRRLRIFLVAIAAVASVNLCIAAGLIQNTRFLYSPSLAYRQQTDALLQGRLSLSSSPANVAFDMAWSEGGVQQVWGLGVPIWRLPFELVARIFSLPAFPDRIALLFAIMLVSYVVLCVFTAPESVHDLNDWFRNFWSNPAGITSVIIVIAFPPVVPLCRGTFMVYEEAVAYNYYYCVGLLAAAVDFTRRPRVWVFLLSAFLAGFAGFVRPTALPTVAQRYW